MNKRLSLEQRLFYLFSFWFVLPLLPCGFIIYYFQLGLLESATLLLFFVLLGSWFFYHSYRSITDIIERIGLQLDALGNEEYNSWHLAAFKGGRVETLKTDFTKLAKKLANKRLEYMHNESFLFEFIQELNLPILVLDHHQQVYLTNAYFYQLVDNGDTILVGKHADSLGLKFNDTHWVQQTNSLFNQRFEISHHTFKRATRSYQLLVFFSIEEQLRENEKLVWQRLIRVLNHEVRNSLTPIYSMSQSLQEMKMSTPFNKEQIETEKNILHVIEKRAEHLLTFVSSYSALSKLSTANKTSLNTETINNSLSALFPSLIVTNSDIFDFFADQGQLEQALINLIKNAFEANDAVQPIKENRTVAIHWSKIKAEIQIKIIDSGTGILNPDNLFVPFYTTKKQGTGIGLILARELIRNQGGEITLKNKLDKTGVEVTILLPHR